MDKYLKKFLDYHKISKNEIIDANGENVHQLHDYMKNNNTLFAYNTTPCQYGHSLKNRNGGCIVCNTASISFLRRSMATGHIYIAGSIIRGYIKIGMSTVPLDHRLSRLNSKRIGNTNDWVLIRSIKCHFANKHELAIHQLLKKYNVEGSLYDGGTESKELFRCSFIKANTTIVEYLSDNNIEVLSSNTYLYNVDNYNFKNLVNKNSQ